jgi:hypothetical protein
MVAQRLTDSQNHQLFFRFMMDNAKACERLDAQFRNQQPARLPKPIKGFGHLCLYYLVSLELSVRSSQTAEQARLAVIRQGAPALQASKLRIFPPQLSPRMSFQGAFFVIKSR